MSQLFGLLLRAAFALPIAGILLAVAAVALTGELLQVARTRKAPAHRNSARLRVVALAETADSTRHFPAR